MAKRELDLEKYLVKRIDDRDERLDLSNELDETYNTGNRKPIGTSGDHFIINEDDTE